MSKKVEKNILVVEDIPLLDELRNGQLIRIASNDVSYLTHTIHKYPAKFIPHIPRWAIRKYLKSSDSLVVDPFCGCGTTLVEAQLHFHNSVGTDIDPLAMLISKVKTTPISMSKLQSVAERIKKKITKKKKGRFVPKIGTLRHWFSREAINQLGIIRDCIEDYRNNRKVYNFLIITFSSIIRQASNADNQSQKTYVSHTHIKKPRAAIPLFFGCLDTYMQRVTELHQLVNAKNKSKIMYADARSIADTWRKQGLPRADLAVTSPPYIKAIDYIYNQMVEYFWVGDLFDLETQQKQNRYKPLYIGTKQVSARQYCEVPKTGYREIDKISTKILSKNRKHAYIVAKFFVDMKSHFEDMKYILKKNAHYVIVVGNNMVSDIAVPSNEFLIQIAKDAGFTCVNHFGYVIKNRFMRFPRKGRGGLIKEDWILDFVL